MESGHIDTNKLYAVVNEEAVLTEPESRHLETCEECMELVRRFVRQRITKRANST